MRLSGPVCAEGFSAEAGAGDRGAGGRDVSGIGGVAGEVLSWGDGAAGGHGDRRSAVLAGPSDYGVLQMPGGISGCSGQSGTCRIRAGGGGKIQEHAMNAVTAVMVMSVLIPTK